MAKGSKRQWKPRSRFKPPKTTYPKEDDGFSGEEYVDDEIDAFHKQRDMIPLDINEGDVSDDEMEHPVFDLKDDVDSDDDDNEDDEDGDGGDVYKRAVDRPTPFEKKIVRQAKFLKQRIGGDDDDIDDGNNEVEEKGKANWGRHKKHYFNADNANFELQSSDEDLQAEEDEALRIQRENAASYSLRDFGLDKDEDDFGEKEKSLNDASIDGKPSYSQADTIYDVNLREDYINVKKDVNALSREEQMDIVYSSAPELVGLLTELNEAVDHLKRVEDLICKMKERNSVTEGAMQYLEMKQRLLLTYCQAIVFYLLLKSEGQSVCDHPVISRLVEIKKLLERVKRLDENIPYENLDTLLNDNHHNAVANEMVKESVTSKPESATTGAVTNGSKAEEQKSATIFKDTVDRELSSRSKEMLKLRASLEEKFKQKGIYNKLKGKRDDYQSEASKQVNRQIQSSDFDDEVAELKENDEMIRLSEPVKLSQLVASRLNKRKLASGEDDVPNRDDIGERRRKHELRVLARAGAFNTEDDDAADEYVGEKINNVSVDHRDGESEESEDEFYKEAKRQRASKLSKKLEMSRVSKPPMEEIEAGDKRHITYQMEKNKGLTRSRKKLTKIPRKKYKVKHQKAVVRRKGQVRDIQRPAGANYAGEASGINTQISHSIRFKS